MEGTVTGEAPRNEGFSNKLIADGRLWPAIGDELAIETQTDQSPSLRRHHPSGRWEGR